MTVYHQVRGRQTAAGVLNVIGSLLAAVLVAHILFVSFAANPANPLVAWTERWANVTGLWFVDLFGTSDPVFTTVLNYGAAAVFWLVVTGFIARLLRSAG